ncbi:MAG: cell division protein FtsX [Neisseriaceae bacterium]
MKLLFLQTRSIVTAIKKILANPIEHLLNILVISLLVCAISGIVILDKTNDEWQKNNVSYPQIMVYLNESATNKDVSKLEITVNNFGHDIIKGYQYISREQGLQELQKDQQLKNITSQITDESENHLPNLLIINTRSSDTKILNRLKNRISNIDFVSSVELDEQYAMKLNNLIGFVNNISNILLIFFGVCIVLIIYNLIRLQMFQNQDEITVSRLIGASDSFIMRPLIYYATLQVVIGGLIAFGLINWFIIYIDKLFINMGALFGKGFILSPIGYIQSAQILIILIVFTIFAVFIAVKSILRKYHPR